MIDALSVTPAELVYLRIAPNEDLVGAVEAACVERGIERAVVRGSLGSLTDAVLEVADGGAVEIRGPAAEVLSLAGEIAPGRDGAPCAQLSGVVCGPDGAVYGGRFARGLNPVCITFEVTIEALEARV
ncbi:MAG: DNA-binding protein [Alphaproteobacteria bacterium]|nr:DNA-binding protein [Alphaproteobacteria bacterium]